MLEVCPVCQQPVNPGWAHFELNYGLDLVPPTGPSTPSYTLVLRWHPWCLRAQLTPEAVITIGGALLSAAKAVADAAGEVVPQ